MLDTNTIAERLYDLQKESNSYVKENASVDLITKDLNNGNTKEYIDFCNKIIDSEVFELYFDALSLNHLLDKMAV